MKTTVTCAAFALSLLFPIAPAWPQICGDGVVDLGEACDDGGTTNGDGCSAYCETENPQSRAQQTCIVALSKSATAVAKAQAKELSRCITSSAKSIESDPALCSITDRRARIRRAKDKVAGAEARSCVTAPDFGYLGASAVADAASRQQVALAADIFGIDVSATTTDFLSNCSGAPSYEYRRRCGRCQVSVVGGYQKVIEAKLAAFARCQKSGLASGYINSRARLEECFDAITADARGKIAKAIAKLSRTTGRRCKPPVAFLPGHCESATGVTAYAACIDTKIECRVCRMINAAQGTAKNCDAFDDGLANGSCSYAAPANPMCMDTPVGQVMFPADETVHTENLEWWYWTGHLQASDGRWFGFEHVFFLTRTNGGAFQMVHHAITDISSGRFQYEVRLGPWDGYQPELGFSFSQDGFTAEGYDGVDLLHGQLPNSTMDLQLRAIKGPVLQHGDGYQDYPSGGFTYYYSRERMEASGTLVIDGTPLQVSGLGWFDHQWGDLLQVTGAGWDWFALQLDDNREIMAAVVHDLGGPILVGGSITDPDCNTTELVDGQVTVTALGQWTSPTTGCVYPTGWDLNIAGINLTLTPVLEDQELLSPVSKYWEGAAVVSGDASGRAYVELVGYCP